MNQQKQYPLVQAAAKISNKKNIASEHQSPFLYAKNCCLVVRGA
ncbi:MAG: hypothetical protein PHY54_11495 [Methylococcales bacterium]|nr:hypothetical protein [Methylococcales bacterium]